MRSFTLDNLLRLCLSSLRPSRKGAGVCFSLSLYWVLLWHSDLPTPFPVTFHSFCFHPEGDVCPDRVTFSLGEQIVTLRKFYLVICFEFPSHDFLFSRSGWESSWWLPQPLAEPFQRGLESSRLMCPCSLRLWNARHREDISVGTLIICLSFSVVHSG